MKKMRFAIIKPLSVDSFTHKCNLNDANAAWELFITLTRFHRKLVECQKIASKTIESIDEFQLKFMKKS